MFTVGSLFSGAGLGNLGLEWAGFEHRFFCENDNYASQVLSKRWPGVPNFGDIKAVDFTQVPYVDLLAGGFPCQDISVAGKGKGIKGERSGLWKEFARAIGDLRPKFALIENSAALTHRGLDTVLCDLAALGYDAEWRCLSAAQVGAPHKRERIWIVGYPCGLGWGKGRENNPINDRPIFTSNDQHSRQMANTDGVRQQQSQRHEQKKWGRFSDSSEKGLMADTAQLKGYGGKHRYDCQARKRQGQAGRSCRTVQQRETTWWSVEPAVGRVVDGCPHRVDRLRCLGNGQVPQCTYFFGRLIYNRLVELAKAEVAA